MRFLPYRPPVGWISHGEDACLIFYIPFFWGKNEWKTRWWALFLWSFNNKCINTSGWIVFNVEEMIGSFSECLDCAFARPCFFFMRFPFFFFFSKPQLLTKSSANSAQKYCSRTHKLHFSVTFSLKMGPTILFTHLKIISL